MNILLTYPFTAIVGQERMKLALLLAVANPRIGGVLIRGEKGTAKSTAVRGLTALLPEIEVVRGCLYGCDPAEPEPCPDCQERRALGPLLLRLRRRVPLINLPVGATPDRVLGRLDWERTRLEGVPCFQPGLLAQANRGILYIDEINLLDPYLSAVLLDAAAAGVNYVERDGFSIAHPAQFILVGTMNPEEGELRPQLADRFAMTVAVEQITDPTEREEVVRRRIAFDADPERFIATWAAAEAATRARLEEARALLPHVAMPAAMLRLLVRLCDAFHVDGLRPDIAMHRVALAHAAYRGRPCVTPDDVRIAAELVLPHRQRPHRPEPTRLDAARLEAVVQGVMAEMSTATATEPALAP
jgi:magnesium chelatase subunit D